MGHSLALAIVSDEAVPRGMLAATLSSAELRQAAGLTPVRRQRHFILGRLAAHRAILRALAAATPPAIEVLTGPSGEPLARVNGRANLVSLSLSHAGRLAVACAWCCAPNNRYAAGVDLERIRPTTVADSTYAFSRAERKLLARASRDRALAGLAAWTVKEAVWKALQPATGGPAEIEVRTLRLAEGYVEVAVGGRLLAPCGVSALRARLSRIDGPDGAYFLACAEIAGPALAEINPGGRGRVASRGGDRSGASFELTEKTP